MSDEQRELLEECLETLRALGVAVRLRDKICMELYSQRADTPRTMIDEYGYRVPVK